MQIYIFRRTKINIYVLKIKIKTMYRKHKIVIYSPENSDERRKNVAEWLDLIHPPM